MNILIIDANNLVHRVRHRLDLSHDGTSVNISFGVIKSILHMFRKFDPSIIVMAWDGRTPEIRYRLVPVYKRRDHSQEADWVEVIRQMNELVEFLPLMGILCVKKENSEADDIMFHASRLFRGYKVIVTSDRDMYQAVSSDCHVFSPIKDILVKPSNFTACTDGIDCEDYVVYKALVGDSSDKIPGVPGIGHKTARSLLDAYGSDYSRMFRDAQKVQLGECKASMPSGVAKKLATCGVRTFIKTKKAIDLSVDITDIIPAILYAVEGWAPPNRIAVANWLQSRMFGSIVGENTLYDMLRLLEDPKESFVRVLE